MQISSVGAASIPAVPAAQVNPQVNQAASEAAEAATQALYGLISAEGGAAESIMNIASGSLDIMA